MAGVDLLLSNALANQIKTNLEPPIEKKLKRRLFSDFGISIKQGIEDFHKVEKILYEMEGVRASRILKKCISEIISAKLSGESYIVILKDSDTLLQFLKYLGDKETRKIINATMHHTLLPTEILKYCKLPKTSGYRKLNILTREGFLVSDGHTLSRTRRSIHKYRMFCTKFTISFEHEKLQIKATVPKKLLESSTLYSLIIASG